ncbi:hypothetical protein FRC02_006305 [Tulasnella sp. 418]|nr:hypothetical protein FRC02_006305 [Tulasnella sp. 418]
MALFRRKRQEGNNNENDNNGSEEPKKGSWKKPANTAFKQQRLKAWQPILTPKTVLPTLFIIGLIFAPIGGLLIWGSSLVTQITLDYTDCDRAVGEFTQLSKYSYQLRAKDSGASYNPPTYTFSQQADAPIGQKSACTIRFDLPADLQPPVFVYYKLTNFHQNHRRYVQSLDVDQLKGKPRSIGDLDDSNCKPLSSIDGKPIYPCGLIANSIYNGENLDNHFPEMSSKFSQSMPCKTDTISNATLLNPAGEAGTSTYVFSNKGIAWPGEAKKYVPRPGYASLSDIVPPPNWRERYPNGYSDQDPPPNLRDDEHFHNWMRTAGLPTFTKLYGRNDNDVMTKGTYQMVVFMSEFCAASLALKSF